jgi:hypothetical protein
MGFGVHSSRSELCDKDVRDEERFLNCPEYWTAIPGKGRVFPNR